MDATGTAVRTDQVILTFDVVEPPSTDDIAALLTLIGLSSRVGGAMFPEPSPSKDAIDRTIGRLRRLVLWSGDIDIEARTRYMPDHSNEIRKQWSRSNARVLALRYGSPIEVTLEVVSLAGGISGILTVLGILVGGPFFVGKKFHRQREEYWQSKTSAETAKREYERLHGSVKGFRLMDVQLPDYLPPAWEDDPDAEAGRS